MTIWIEDSDGNKCSVEYFGSKKAAQKALDSLENCNNCINCSDCSDCSDCSNCSYCRYCSYCSNCSNCSYCRGCSYCSDCSNFSYCSDCSNCSYCSYCRDCSNCSYCRDCSGCSDCNYKKNEAFEKPIIKNIHQRVYAAASQPDALNMSDWHTCETTHCRAGWVVHLAGDAGRELEKFFDTCLAAQIIYRESSPLKVSVNRFFDTNESAMEDMKRLAKEESALSQPEQEG